MVCSGVLDNQTLIADHAREDGGLLDGPLANIGPLLVLVRVLGVLLGVGGLPAGLPVIGELLKERGLEGGGLQLEAWLAVCLTRLRCTFMFVQPLDPVCALQMPIGGFDLADLCCASKEGELELTVKVGKVAASAEELSSPERGFWASSATAP